MTTAEIITPERILEAAERSEAHAHAISVVLMLQAGLDRQSRIIHLRAELERLTGLAAHVRKELRQAEEEHTRDRMMVEDAISRFQSAASNQDTERDGAV